MKTLATCMFLLAAACARDTPVELPPLGQLLLVLDTDAPLPPAAGTALGPADPLPLFDRVRIEVRRPGEDVPCPDCTNEFDLDRERVGALAASVGITTPPGASGYTARVRLFRAAGVVRGEPAAAGTIDVLVALPAAGVEGITTVTAVLRTADVGKPLDPSAAPTAPVLGRPDRSLVGSWPPAQRTPCVGEAKDPELCIRGGAYWMDAGARIVALSPFWLDAREVLVPELRASKLVTSTDPLRYSPNNPSAPLQCTFTTTRGTQEDLPASCVSRELARAYCQKRGADLPTLAQFQYVATGFGRSLYVWGSDPPSCRDAVFARGTEITNQPFGCPGSWVDVPGSGARDRLAVTGGVVVDLAGNLAEHVLDYLDLPDGACWGPGGILVDPLCATPSAAARNAYAVAGGAWLRRADALAGTSRDVAFDFDQARKSGPTGGDYQFLATTTGFRCARPATAP